MAVLVRALNALLMIAMPLALGVVLARRLRSAWGVFGLGALAFLGSQVLHIPFNLWLLTPLLEHLGLEANAQGVELWAVACLLGLSAGLFEEGARAVVYARSMKEARRWRDGIMLGAGHGGLEAMLLGALALYGLVQAIALRGTDLAVRIPLERVESVAAQVEAYWAMPWHLAILGAVERLGALCLHLGLSVLVLQSFRRRNVAWWLAAVLWHSLVNALAVVANSVWGPYHVEAVVLVAALLSVAMVFALRGSDEADRPPPVSPFPTISGRREPTDAEVRRGLEDSRFSE